MLRGAPCKENVTISLLRMMRQPTEKKTQKGEGAMTKKPRDLEPLMLEMPAEDKKLVPEISGDSKTICGMGQWSSQVENEGRYQCNRPESLVGPVRPRC